MQKRVAVSCKTCKLYNFPLYYLGGSYFHTKYCQTKRAHPCPCVKEGKKNEVDSLKAMRPKRETQDLDDKIKNLKIELTSLIGESSKSKAGNNNNDLNARDGHHGEANSGIKLVPKRCVGNPSSSGSRLHVNPQYRRNQQVRNDNNALRKEFSQWLDSTIDSLTVPSDGDKSEPATNARNVNFDLIDDDSVECAVATDYVTQNELQIAQELLYESFLIQKYPLYVPSRDNQDLHSQPLNLNKRRHENTEARRLLIKRTRTSYKRQGSEPNRNMNNRVKTLTIHDNSDSDVEVINIDDDTDNTFSVIKRVDGKKDETQVIQIKDKPQVLQIKDKPQVIQIKDDEPTPEKVATPKESPLAKKGVWECPICFEQNTGQEVVATMCGHVFCKKCLDDYYVTHSKSCPNCRTDLNDKPVITLFNF